MRTVLCLVSILSLLAAAGCRDKDASNGVDAGTGDGGGGDDVKIQDIQNDNMPVGQAVTVRGVVVVHIDTFGSRTGGVYVQEPEGGEYSGVFVFLSGTQAAGLAVGDLVDITGGEKDEFALSEDTSGRTLTEISAPQGGTITMTKTGTGTVPTPPVLNPWDLAGDDAEAEKWEGVTVTFNTVSVLSAPRMVTMSDPTILEMNITGPFPVQNSLTQLENTLMRDDCLASITGIVDYFFDYKLLPRSAADIATGGSGCPAQEMGDTACADLMDNDYDGFADCSDRSCQDLDMCKVDTTVVGIQDGTVTEGSVVTLTDVYVVAVSFSRKNLWVADSPTAAANNGVYVHFGFSTAPTLPAEIVAGATVDVTGTVDEYFDLTEITSPTVTFKSAPGGTAAVALGPVTYTDLIGDNAVASGEPYEGVLVRIENVNKVNTMTFGRFTVGTATDELIVGQEIYRHTPAGTECYESITGILHHSDIDDTPAVSVFRRTLSPRSAADVVTKACN